MIEIVVNQNEISYPFSIREICGEWVVGKRWTYEMKNDELIITVFADE